MFDQFLNVDLWYTFLPLFGLINFGFSKGSSSSYGQSGAVGWDKEKVSSAYTGNVLRGASLAHEAATSPFGTFMGQTTDQLAPVNQYGLDVSTTPAVEEMLKFGFNRASSAGMRQGRWGPMNTPAIAGSAIQNTLPQLLPQINAYSQWRRMLPEQLYASRLGFYNTGAQMAAPGLGSISASSSSQFGFGGGYGDDAKK